MSDIHFLATTSCWSTSDAAAAQLIQTNQERDAHVKPWSRYLSPHTIGEAMRYTPLISVFAYASVVSRDVLKGPDTGAYLRGLIRRMKREADQLAVGGPCAQYPEHTSANRCGSSD